MSTTNSGRGDTAGDIFGLSAGVERAAVVLVPVPFEATTSYGRGAVNGPGAILKASAQVDLYDVETGQPYRAGIVMLPESSDLRAWNERAGESARLVLDAAENVDVASDARVSAARDDVNRVSTQVHEFVEAEVERWLDDDKIVGLVGGDHSVSFGSIAAHARRYPGLGILHIDAHADLRHEYLGFTWSHASIMENVMRRIPDVARLVQVGIRDLCEEENERIRDSGGRIRTHFDAELTRQRFEGATWGEQVARIVYDLPGDVFISFDVDGLDAALCPHTGTPVPGGLSFHQATYLIGAVACSGRRVVGFDLVEVAPDPNGSEWDGNVGARLLYKLIGWTLRSRAASGPSKDAQ
jgi:agmatinase